MDDLIITQMPGWVKITLNRPAVKNALNTAVLAALAAALTICAADPKCHAVLICGAAGNFAAGADVSEIVDKTSAEAAVDPRKTHWAAIRAFPKPLVAAVDGYALGAGFELALMADFIVLGADAKLGLPESNLGLIPGAGGGQRLLALAGRARASRLVMLGEVIDATTAYDWGIAGWMADGPALPLATEIVARLCNRAPLAMITAKAALVAGAEAALAFDVERAGFERLMDSADKAEGLAAFKARRRAVFTRK